MKYRLLIAGILTAVFCAGYFLLVQGPEQLEEKPVSAGRRGSIEKTDLERAVLLSTDYLRRSCKKNGQFVYRVNINPKVEVTPSYNMLRHAGAIYALCMADERFPSSDTKDAVLRSARYLKGEALRPVAGRGDMAGIWSLAAKSRANKPDQAKLGGTGLGLIALISAEKILPGTTSLDDLQKMGRFLLYMQKENGGFYSKFIPSKGGRDDSWTSLYYPGEAALGLLMLYEKDPSPAWLQGAAGAISYLAQIRMNRKSVEADHWALMATAKLLPLYDRCEQPLPREALIQHAIQICRSILRTGRVVSKKAFDYGCLTNDGRTTPTATRLEGLLAALTFLPEEESLLRQRINVVVEAGVGFLLRSQLHYGKYAGGFPRSVYLLKPGHPQYSEAFNQRSSEIRIDYVQHALCAMLQYGRSTQMNN